MLCSRSASLTMMTRMSSTIARSILRKFSAWRSSLDENGIVLILVTPSTTWATSGAKQLLDALDGRQGVLDDVVEQAGGDGHHVQPHVRQEVGHLQGVHHIGLARMAHLSLVLEGRKHVGPAKQFEVGIGVVAPDLLDQIFEANHAWWCLITKNGVSCAIISWGPVTGCLTLVFSVHYTGPVSAFPAARCGACNHVMMTGSFRQAS